MGMQRMVITLILYAVSFLPRDISTTGISLISSFEVVCKKAFRFARDCLCVLWSMPEHIWKAKCVFRGHFRSQSTHTTHSCSTHTTFTLPAQKKPLLPKSTGDNMNPVQSPCVECVADHSWSPSTASVQSAHHYSTAGKKQSACRSWSCLMLKFNLVYFPKGSASRTALHRCKPSHPFHVWVRIPLLVPQIPSLLHSDSLSQALFLLNWLQADLCQSDYL